MKFSKYLPLIFILLLLSGCLKIHYTQKVDRDGSSTLITETDLNDLKTYAQELKTTGFSYNKPSVTPDDSYSASSYSSLPKPEDVGLSLRRVLTFDPDQSVIFDAIIANNLDYQITDLEVSVKSREFVASTKGTENSVKSIPIGPSQSGDVSVLTYFAGNSGGNYSATIIISFKDKDGKTIQAAKTEDVEFTIRPSPTPAAVDPTLSALFDSAYTKLSQICDGASGIVECSIQNGKLRYVTKIKPGENYKFSSDNGFPYVKYTVEIRSEEHTSELQSHA
jgi:hypothetical protein